MVFKPGTGFASSNYVANAKKLNPFRVHSMRSFIPHVAHFIRQRGAIKGTTRTELRCYIMRLWCCIARIMLTIFHSSLLEIGRFGSNVVWLCTKIPLMICFLKAGSTVNSVRVVLLKARGWRGTSLPRVCDNMWFSNPVRVLLLPITWRMRKSWTRSGFILHAYLFPT